MVRKVGRQVLSHRRNNFEDNSSLVLIILCQSKRCKCSDPINHIDCISTYMRGTMVEDCHKFLVGMSILELGFDFEHKIGMKYSNCKVCISKGKSDTKHW